MLLGRYVNKLPARMHKALHDAASQLATEPVFWYVDDIEQDIVDELYVSQDDIFSNNPGRRLTMVMQSPGGDIRAAFQLIALLRRRFDDLDVLIPYMAKSAATLVCLGATSITMTGLGELGPLDPQVRKPGKTIPRPVLNDYRAFDALRRDTFVTLDLFMKLLLRRTGMDVDVLLDRTMSFVADLLGPVYQRIDPFAHGTNMQTLAISREYAKVVLSRWGNLQGRSADAVAERLAETYPSHDFVIDYEGARDIGLPVQMARGNLEAFLRSLIPTLNSGVKLVGTLDPLPTSASTGESKARRRGSAPRQQPRAPESEALGSKSEDNESSSGTDESSEGSHDDRAPAHSDTDLVGRSGLSGAGTSGHPDR